MATNRWNIICVQFKTNDWNKIIKRILTRCLLNSFQTPIPGLFYPSFDYNSKEDANDLSEIASRLKVSNNHGLDNLKPIRCGSGFWRQAQSSKKFDESTSVQLPQIKAAMPSGLSNSVKVRRINRTVLLIQNETFIPKVETSRPITLPPIQSNIRITNQTSKPRKWAYRDFSAVNCTSKPNFEQQSSSIVTSTSRYSAHHHITKLSATVRNFSSNHQQYKPFGK